MVMRRIYSVGVAAGFFASLFGCDQGPKRLPELGFQVEFPSHKVAAVMNTDTVVVADVTVKNASPVTWPSKPDHKNRYAVNLSYHWIDRSGETVVFDGLRTPLPRDLAPGESVDLKVVIQTPEKPGHYTLEVTLVQEQWAWFPEKKGAKLTLPVRVTAADEKALEMAVNKSAESPRSRAESRTRPSPLVEGAANQAAKTGNPDAGASGLWSVQLASSADRRAAESLVQRLKSKGYDAYVMTAMVKGKQMHRVRVGEFAQRAEAEKLRQTLRIAENFDQAIVTNR